MSPTPARIDLVRGWAGVPGWLDPVEAAVLEAAVLSTAPGTAIVECGTWCGRSLLALAAARAKQAEEFPGCARRPLVSVDLYPEVGQAQEAGADQQQITPHEAKNICTGLLSALGVPDVHRIFSDAVEAAEALSTYALLAKHKVGVLYLDDHHVGSRVIDEIAAWEPHLADEAEVLIHDFFHEPYGIEAAVDRWLAGHPEWFFVEARLSMARLRRRWKVAPRPAATAARVYGDSIVSDCWLPEHRAGGTARPLVSVLYNTWRLGGIDCLKVGLDRQTADSATFEAVIVDALYPYRHEEVYRLFKNAPYRVKHVNPTGNPFPRDHGNLARNDAIRAADGDVCVWWCDYSIAQPDSIERHYTRVARSGFRASSVGHIVYGDIALEALHPDMMAALPWRTVDDYVDFVEGLTADSPLWLSIFREPVMVLGQKQLITTQRGHSLPYDLRGKVVKTVQDRIPAGCDERLTWLNGAIPDTYYYAKNEATARSVLYEINGWEEAFDDGHAQDDHDIGRRLSLAKSSMVLDKGNECFIPNPRPFWPLMRWKRAPIDNRGLYEELAQINRPRAFRGLVDECDQFPHQAAQPVAATAEATA